MGDDSSKLLVLAIEVGNEKSGFAFAFRDKNNISSEIYTTTDDTNRQIGRIPTALLLKEDLSFDNFGFYAEQKYMSLSLKNEHLNYTYVNNLEISQSDNKFSIRDCRGKEIEAVRIYSIIINHLIEISLSQVKRYARLEKLEKHLLLTVPDNVRKELGDSLKSLIKDVKNVRFVITSEAAAAYCVSQQFIIDEKAKTKRMQNDTSFIFVNFGRRFSSVCFQRITSSDKHKTLQESKLETGGDFITDIFFQEIRDRYEIGEDWNKFRVDHFCDYMNLRRMFDYEKQKFNNTTECVLIEMPTSIIHLMKQNDDRLDKSMVMKDDKIIISNKAMKDYFQRSLTSLISKIQEIVNDSEDNINFILLLGGYSKSPVVRKIIKEGVRPRKVILVSDPEIGVLKGAVMLGFQGNNTGS